MKYFIEFVNGSIDTVYDYNNDGFVFFADHLECDDYEKGYISYQYSDIKSIKCIE